MNYNLVIDTIGKPARIILFNKQLIFETNLENQNTYSTFLHEKLKILMENNGVKHIENIYVVAGPGSYTGIKIAAAAAQGLAMAWQIPVYYLCNLDFYFYQYLQSQNSDFKSICILKPAREKEYFCAIYNHQGRYDFEPNLILEANFNMITNSQIILLIYYNEQDKLNFMSYFNHDTTKFIPESYTTEVIITTIDNKTILGLLKPIIPFETEPFYLKEVYFR